MLPARVPPARVPPEESFGFLWQVGTGFLNTTDTSPKPGTFGEGCNLSSGVGCTVQARSTWLFNALAGAHTRDSERFFLLAYYKFSLFWDVVAKNGLSVGNWFQSPRSESSPLPTRGLLQIHELFADSRYLAGPARFGLQIQFSYGRSNLQTFAQTGEVADTSFTSESFVPYAIYVANRYYRARVYVPINTVVNHEDEDSTYTTFSLNSKGRGRVYSGGLANLFYVPPADTVINWDLVYTDYKFASVANDRARFGTTLAATYAPPYGHGAFIQPKFFYFKDTYVLPTVVSDGFTVNTIGENIPNSEPRQVERKDTGFRYGTVLGFDFLAQHRVQFEASWTVVDSTAVDWKSRSSLFLLRYDWTAPSTTEVGRFLRNTERNPLNGTFEGDGGL